VYILGTLQNLPLFSTGMMKFIRHSGSTTQYNTMQSNVKKQKRRKEKKRKKRV